MGIKRWIIRCVLGFGLGAAAAFVVLAMTLAFVTLVFGGLDDYLSRKHPREERWLHEFVFGVMIGAEPAAFIASFLAVMMAPVRYGDRLVIRSWIMAATLGAVAGGYAGGMITKLHPQYLEFETIPVVVLSVSVLTGIAAAIVLRLFVNR